jgi:hypothetical protein
MAVDDMLHLDDSSSYSKVSHAKEVIDLNSSSCDSSGNEPIAFSKKRKFAEAFTEQSPEKTAKRQKLD